jgi:dephospho-CoA kinase|tara:strand:- start:421 stop:1086 length:666 start_codon:yes stop_codon:yes gene_type:complete
MISFNELQEGVYDPNILKAFFLAGGPGSGKSYVVRQTTGGLGLKIVNSDKAFEKYLKDANLSLKMPDEEKYDRDPVRAKAKKITQKQKSNYVEGRLGLIIDGTGKNYAKISDEATRLKQLGYDVHMVFVNTSLDTALERNKRRSRSVPESLVIKSWKDVQSNIGKFSQYFRKNFVVVDNNDTDEDVMTPVYKQIKSLALAKISNPLGKQWVANELSKKKRK